MGVSRQTKLEKNGLDKRARPAAPFYRREIPARTDGNLDDIALGLHKNFSIKPFPMSPAGLEKTDVATPFVAVEPVSTAGRTTKDRKRRNGMAWCPLRALISFLSALGLEGNEPEIRSGARPIGAEQYKKIPCS
jgi:hypothetical protein